MVTIAQLCGGVRGHAPSACNRLNELPTCKLLDACGACEQPGCARVGPLLLLPWVCAMHRPCCCSAPGIVVKTMCTCILQGKALLRWLAEELEGCGPQVWCRLDTSHPTPASSQEVVTQSVHLDHPMNVRLHRPCCSTARGNSRSALHCTWPDHAQGAGAR